MTIQSFEEEAIIPVQTNIGFSVEIPASCNWVHGSGEFDETTTMVILTVNENTSGSSRSVTIKFKAEEGRVPDIDITITQEA